VDGHAAMLFIAENGEAVASQHLGLLEL